MAIQDTHRAFELLTAAGYSKQMAEALLDTLADSRDTLATKADLRELELAMRADLSELAQTTKADLRELKEATKAELSEPARAIESLQQAVNEMATKADLRELERSTKSDLRELELRMTVKLGAMLFAAVGVLIAMQLLPL